MRQASDCGSIDGRIDGGGPSMLSDSYERDPKVKGQKGCEKGGWDRRGRVEVAV